METCCKCQNLVDIYPQTHPESLGFCFSCFEKHAQEIIWLDEIDGEPCKKWYLASEELLENNRKIKVLKNNLAWTLNGIAEKVVILLTPLFIWYGTEYAGASLFDWGWLCGMVCTIGITVPYFIWQFINTYGPFDSKTDKETRKELQHLQEQNQLLIDLMDNSQIPEKDVYHWIFCYGFLR